MDFRYTENREIGIEEMLRMQKTRLTGLKNSDFA